MPSSRKLLSAAQRARARGEVLTPGTRGRKPELAITKFLRDAAIELIAKRPLSSVTVEEICKRAGVGRPSFYRRFGSPHELFVLAIDWIAASLEESPSPSDDVFADLATRLHEVARHSTRTSAGRAVRALGGQVLEDGDVTRALERLDRCRRRLFASLFARAEGQGRLRAGIDHDTAYEVTVGAVMMRTAFSRQADIDTAFVRVLCELVLVS